MNSRIATADQATGSPLKWSAEALGTVQLDDTNQAAIIGAAQAAPVVPDLDIWDAWPLADRHGNPVAWRGGELWFALAVPRADDPEDRHHLARIHHFHRLNDTFIHCGETLPRDISPGAREWSGSARLDDDVVTLFFTAAGQLGDTTLTYHQRLYQCSTTLSSDGEFQHWSKPVEFLEADGAIYRPADQNHGEPGRIKGFRDPAYFHASDGREYVLFTGSSAAHPGTHDGVIGLALKQAQGGYAPLPPLIDATGVSNELERPHIIEHSGMLYLFWSTQRGVFAPGLDAPTGLYGATARSLEGPWTLLNGHGLVIANPLDHPTQAYSWWVLPDLSIASFVDYWGPQGPDRNDAASRRARFGGTFAPFLQIALEGATSRIVAGE